MKIAGFFLLLCSFVSGHAYISKPEPRAHTIPGHHFHYEPQSDAAEGKNCMDGGKTGPIQATYTEGSIITTSVHVTVFHNGWWELRFCPDAHDSLACYQKHRATPVTVSEQYKGKKLPNSDNGGNNNVRANFPLGNVCGQSWSGSPVPTTHCFQYHAGADFHFDTKWQLPPGLTCDHCGMQFWWVTDNGGNENFKSCHDVAIKASSGNVTNTNVTIAE